MNSVVTFSGIASRVAAPNVVRSVVAVAVVLSALPAEASAAFITFGNQSIDQLNAAGPQSEAGFTYQAITGPGWEVQNVFGNPASSLVTFFNGEGSATGDTVNFTKTGGGTFTFVSLDTATILDANSDEVTVTGFLGVNPVGSFLLNTSTAGPSSFQTVASPFTGLIDRLEVRVSLASFNNARLLDNFQFATDAPTAVPEPSSLTLMGTAAFALVGFARRPRRGPNVAA